MKPAKWIALAGQYSVQMARLIDRMALLETGKPRFGKALIAEPGQSVAELMRIRSQQLEGLARYIGASNRLLRDVVRLQQDMLDHLRRAPPELDELIKHGITG